MAKSTRVSQTFGQQVRECRGRRGWTQPELCDRLEKLGEPMNVSTIARIERGKRGVSVDDVMVFAIALGVAPVYLLLPRADAPVTLASGVTVGGWEALAWARGVYHIGWSEAPDLDAARASDDVRFYYESCPDYEADAIRRAPLVRDVWHAAYLAMSFAGGVGDGSHRKQLKEMLERIIGTASLALGHLETYGKKGS